MPSWEYDLHTGLASTVDRLRTVLDIGSSWGETCPSGSLSVYMSPFELVSPVPPSAGRHGVVVGRGSLVH